MRVQMQTKNEDAGVEDANEDAGAANADADANENADADVKADADIKAGVGVGAGAEVFLSFSWLFKEVNVASGTAPKANFASEASAIGCCCDCVTRYTGTNASRQDT